MCFKDGAKIHLFLYFCACEILNTMRPIVTLISDWRTRDPYIAMFKGSLLNTIPDALIVDISHVVELYNLNQTAFLTKHSYKKFPEGSIHILLTNASINSLFSPVVIEYDHHYFISEDNGVLFMMFNMYGPMKGRQYVDDTTNAIEKIIRLTEAVCNNTLESVTTEYRDFRHAFAPLPIHFSSERKIEGEIVYIDAYFNAITNIPTSMFKEAVQKNAFEAIILSKNSWKSSVYHDKYQPEEDIYLTSNALDCLEITMYQADVAILADFKVGDKVIIKY